MCVDRYDVPGMIANEISDILGAVYYIDTFNPTYTSNTFISLHNNLKPCYNKPLIVVLKQCENIYSDTNKQRYLNKFMDKINDGLFPYVILIMTSYEPIYDIMNKGPMHLETGRINIVREIKKE